MDIFVEVIINSFCRREKGQLIGYSVSLTAVDGPGGEMRAHYVANSDELEKLLRGVEAEDLIPEIMSQLNAMDMSIVTATLKSELLAIYG